MRQYILLFKQWYELRSDRERILVLLLMWALLYVIFNFGLFRGLDKREEVLKLDIKLLSDQAGGWKQQVAAINQLSREPRYQQWLKQRQLFSHLKGKSLSLLQLPISQQWQNIINTILQEKRNVTLVQIKNFPESPYSLPNVSGASTVSEQRFLVTIYSNFFDTVNYLQYLEGVLPNVRWNSLSYQVTQYPIAKVELEFSIFYG